MSTKDTLPPPHPGDSMANKLNNWPSKENDFKKAAEVIEHRSKNKKEEAPLSPDGQRFLEQNGQV